MPIRLETSHLKPVKTLFIEYATVFVLGMDESPGSNPRLGLVCILRQFSYIREGVSGDFGTFSKGWLFDQSLSAPGVRQLAGAHPARHLVETGCTCDIAPEYMVLEWAGSAPLCLVICHRPLSRRGASRVERRQRLCVVDSTPEHQDGHNHGFRE